MTKLYLGIGRWSSPTHTFDATNKSFVMKLLSHISDREIEILRLVAYEFTTQEIAQHLFLSHHTVDSHKKNLKSKLNVRNSAGLVRKGFELGFLQIAQAS